MLSSLTCLRKRGSRFYRLRRFNGVGAVHFVILSGGKRRMLVSLAPRQSSLLSNFASGGSRLVFPCSSLEKMVK